MCGKVSCRILGFFAMWFDLFVFHRPDLLHWNLNAVSSPLTEKERMLVEDIRGQ